MRSTFKILPYINRKRIKSDGTTAVLCRVSIDGKSILITTGIFCRPEDWNSQTGTIRQPRENNRLAEFRLNLERAYDRLLKEQGAVSAELLKNAVTGVATIPQTLLKGGEAERERLRLRAEQIHSTSTFRQSKTTQLNLQQFLQSRGLEDIAFSDITEEFGHSFKLFLKKELGYASGHVNHCLCWLNRLIYIAVDEISKRSVSNLNKIKEDYKPKLVIIGPAGEEVKPDCNINIVSENEIQQMFANVVICQQLALETALKLKRNVDHPRGLHKVVVDKNI